ncbi:hypothetical protein [Escherichia phage BEK3]|nr:hypothetical protein [Escherichia phage BEK2]QGH76777.1 hypothetical protein [Escherichia phage BEK3]
MGRTSKVVYLGSNTGECGGFTVGKEYKAYNYNTEYNYISTYDDKGSYRQIKNGAFHHFKLHDEDDHFVTETECAVMQPSEDKKPSLIYCINGHEVDMIEFENVRHKVLELDAYGVKCDTIKFEVKFE